MEPAPNPAATVEAEAAIVPAAPRYRQVRTYQFAIAGAGAVGQGYTLGALLATGALIYCAASKEGDQSCAMHPSPGAFRELFVPVAGPWLALRRDDVHGSTGYALLFGGLGAVQAAGLLFIAYDLAVPRYRRERQAALSVGAVADANTQVLVVKGSF